MRIAANDQLIIEAAASYCNKLTLQILPDATSKKLHECAKLGQIFFFPLNNGHKSLSTNCTISRKKYTKNYKHILNTKITTFPF